MGVGKLERSKCAIRKAAICGAVAAAIISCNCAMGTTYTWSGLSGTQPPFIPNPFWSTSSNWFAPGIPVSSSSTDLIFGPSAFPAPLQNLGEPFVVSSLNFPAGGGGYVLQGGTLSLQGAATITQNSANAEVVQNSLAFPAGGTYTGSGSMTMTGALSGTNLTVNSTGILTLAGGGAMSSVNVISGEVDVTAGVLNLTTNGSLGVGSGSSGGGLVISGGAVVNVNDKTNTALSVVGSDAGSSLLITGTGSKLTADVLYGGSISNRVQSSYIYVTGGGALNGGEFNLTGSESAASGFALTTGATASHNTAYVGWLTGTRGEVTIDGAGSAWTVGNFLELGARNSSGSGTGVITVQNQGVLVAGKTFFDSPTSKIDVEGGSYATGVLNSADYGYGVITLFATAGGTALSINGASGSGIYYGSISGESSVAKSGGSTQTLAGANTYTGTTTVNGGTLILASGASPSYTVNSGGTLSFNFGNFGFSTLRANAGGTIQYNVLRVLGGFLRGVGTHNIDGVSSFSGTTFGGDVTLSQNARLTLSNVTNSGSFHNNASLIWDGGSNTSAGSVIANAAITTSSFENNGTITINAGGTINNSLTKLVNGGGARMIVNHDGSIFLSGGTSLELNGSLLVNNGVITGTTNVNFGSLAKGAGTYGAVNITDGGRFSPGNSPGSVTTGSASWNSGGNYLVELSSATGAAGIDWDLWNVDGLLSMNAATGVHGKFKISLSTLEINSPGLAANFDPARNYDWVILHADQGIVGFDLSQLFLDTSAFENDLAGGQFSLASSSTELAVHFSAIPEPAALVFLALAAPVTLRRRCRS